MSMTKEEAESALRDIDAARADSRVLYGYKAASPYLLVWGSLWIVASLLITFTPYNPGAIWLAINAVGVVMSTYIAISDARQSSRGAGLSFGLRYGATAIVIAIFIAGTFAVFSPVSGAQIQTFIVMLIAMIYTVMGVWFGIRYAAIGLLVGALAAGSYFYVPDYLTLITAGLGGGALVLAGLWLRRA